MEHGLDAAALRCFPLPRSLLPLCLPLPHPLLTLLLFLQPSFLSSPSYEEYRYQEDYDDGKETRGYRIAAPTITTKANTPQPTSSSSCCLRLNLPRCLRLNLPPDLGVPAPPGIVMVAPPEVTRNAEVAQCEGRAARGWG